MAAYDYLSLELARRPTPHLALAEALRAAAPRLERSRGEIVGQFSPQLGWANNQAAVLVRWLGAPGDLSAITGADCIAAAERRRLSPTLRPGDEDVLKPDGVYVHRWFEVEPGAADEFVTLSGEGWTRFEAQFDTHIFGLFREAPASDGDVARLLLLTFYADHGDWEASRDPTSEAMQIFLRRQQLTRRTWAASTRTVEVG